MIASVLSSGFQTSVQDCGRVGFRKFGVGTAGALDAGSLRLINLVVGNDEFAAGLEIASGRLRLRMNDDRLIAWSGGEFEVRIGNTGIRLLHCARAPASAIIEMQPRRSGRAWLAISGGISVPEVLGSCSTDLRARFGGLAGRVLRDGDELPLGGQTALSQRIAEQLPEGVSDWSGPLLFSRTNVLRIVAGSNWDDFGGAITERLCSSNFRVALESDRMGLRLEGSSLRSLDRELISEAVMPGTIQVPRNGAPIVLLADCQTIGGYPKIAHVITVDLARAAQLQPLDEIRFELIALAEAWKLLFARERDIARFRVGLQTRFG
jgi:antagonist of KipI